MAAPHPEAIPIGDGTFLLIDARGDLAVRINESGELLSKHDASEWFVVACSTARASIAEHKAVCSNAKDLYEALFALVSRIKQAETLEDLSYIDPSEEEAVLDIVCLEDFE